MDIDLLGSHVLSQDGMVSAIADCLSVPVPEDGIQFDPRSLTADAIAKGDGYDGWRLRFRGRLGKARITLQIDCGFGDVIIPKPVRIEYPVLLSMPVPSLLAYTAESTIAEKYQAMVFLDLANSRMKDFFDLWTLARGFTFEGERLCRALKATFNRRRTPIPEGPPVAFTAAFFENRAKQVQWSAFLRKGQLSVETPQFGQVVSLLREFLMPPTQALAQGVSFDGHWSAGGPWRPRNQAV
jgi:hypothetical protein